jgi:NDP-sugar pyrophosphorylase family protein
VGLGAVVTIGREYKESPDNMNGLAVVAGAEQGSAFDLPLECIEIAGRSPLERLIERFAAIDTECISVLVEAGAGASIPAFRNPFNNVVVREISDFRSAIEEEVSNFLEQGIGHAFVTSANAYVETDLLDLFCFHREARQVATRAYDQTGWLDLWVVDCAKSQRGDLGNFLDDAVRAGAPKYFIREYVNRLLHPRDLRQFAADILRRKCETGPSGTQVRPGVWMDEDAEVHRRARIVAPAYIGCASKIRADALITRLSDIESNCCVDSGTVVEDSSVLANTTVGICLDLCHAVASGNRLWNLERDVVVEIVDPSVIRFNSEPRKAAVRRSQRIEALKNAVLQKQQTPPTWQFDKTI